MRRLETGGVVTAGPTCTARRGAQDVGGKGMKGRVDGSREARERGLKGATREGAARKETRNGGRTEGEKEGWRKEGVDTMHRTRQWHDRVDINVDCSIQTDSSAIRW